MIYYYSIKINPDRSVENPNNIIGIFDFNHMMAIILSSTLFLLVLGAFIKTLFIDHREDFNIDFKTRRTIFLFLLVVSFISAVYVLLDVALKNVYMTIGPIDAVWLINKYIFPIPTIPASTSRLAYAQIRTYYFFFFYLFMLIFPIVMFVILLTRYGRKKFFSQEQEMVQRKSQTSSLKVFGILFTPLLLIYLNDILNSPVMTNNSRLLILTPMIALLAWWIFEIIRLILKGIKLTAIFSYESVVLFFPLAFLFYILPIIIWTGWDFFMIISNNSTTKTILTELNSPLANTTVKLSSLSLQDFFNVLVNELLYNGIAIIRIIQLDFVFVVAGSALAIGFAEGYSIISIFTALFKGVNIARTGKVVSQSSPKLIVIGSRIVMLGAWVSFFWDRITVFVGVLQNYFAVFFPFIVNVHLPRIFDFFINLRFNINLTLLGIFVPSYLLLIPLYYILMSSFKFLSVSLIVDKTKNDQQVYFLLISSAFVLIATNILQDITSSILYNSSTTELAYLPTSFATAQFFLSFANKIFELVESIAFVVGLFVAVFVLLRKLSKKVREKRVQTEIKGRQSLYGSYDEIE